MCSLGITWVVDLNLYPRERVRETWDRPLHEGVLLCYVTTPLLRVAMLDLDQLSDFPGAQR